MYTVTLLTVAAVCGVIKAAEKLGLVSARPKTPDVDQSPSAAQVANRQLRTIVNGK